MSDCGPPEDRARNIATFRRTKNGHPEELRLGLESYNGHPFVSLRTWTPAASGAGHLFPSKLSVTIRRGELVGVIEALTRVARELDMLPPEDGGPSTWKHYGGDGGSPRPKPGPRPRPDVSVDHARLYAGQGRRRVDLSAATRDSAFDALVERKLED